MPNQDVRLAERGESSSTATRPANATSRYPRTLLILTADGLIPYSGFHSLDPSDHFEAIEAAPTTSSALHCRRLFGGAIPEAVLLEDDSPSADPIRRIRQRFGPRPLLIVMSRSDAPSEILLRAGADEVILSTAKQAWREVQARLQLAAQRREWSQPSVLPMTNETVPQIDLGAHTPLRNSIGAPIEARPLIEALGSSSQLVAFQPIYSYRSDRSIGAEALFRSPDANTTSDLIAVAETTGVIAHLDECVLKGALALFTSANSEEFESLNVNTSAASLSDAYITMLQRALDVSGLDPRRLSVELSATQWAASEELTRNLQQLRSIGVQVVLDDFHQSHCRLELLAESQAQSVKLDAAMVADLKTPSRQLLCRAVIELAHELGLTVTAEGIEREEQFELLRELGCDYAQGYFIAPPVAFDHLRVA